MIIGEGPLGAGGNGQVWRARAADGRAGAIKLLFAGGGLSGRYRLGRFLDEIAFLRAHPDTDGILPLLDSSISDDPRETSWYVMPVARPIRDALGSDPKPALVVGAVAAIATTLASLANEGVAHRDIKPDNLFELDSRWVIGDFGLVTYPDKDPRTEHGRKLGPVDYMAPEMRRDADRADPGPADVWALAKTLWVLLTGLELPLPGTHRPVEAAYALREWITFGFAAELDLLMEKATMIEPEARVSMADMAKELQACITPPPETKPQASLAELSVRAASLTAASRLQAAQRQERQGQLAVAWQELAQVVADAATELNDLLKFYVHSQDSGYRAAELLGHPPFTPHDAQSAGWLLLPVGQERAAATVVVAVAFRVLSERDPADIAAIVRVDRILDHGNIHEPHVIWTQTYLGTPVASAQQANVLAGIRAGFSGSFSGVLRQVIEILSSSGSSK
jgi:serine/threonine protein kinase